MRLTDKFNQYFGAPSLQLKQLIDLLDELETKAEEREAALRIAEPIVKAADKLLWHDHDGEPKLLEQEAPALLESLLNKGVKK